MPPPSQPQPSAHILLLKTKSSPHDGYEEFFSVQSYSSKPTFIPVLSHNFQSENLVSIKALFENGSLLPPSGSGSGLGTESGRRYGGLIFTSQRAVEAFADMITSVDASLLSQSSTHLPLYTVGPATARSLTSLRDKYLPHATIHGAETGNGENLARYILEHYNSLHPDQGSDENQKPPLLFLVGETRRDIIPKTLTGEDTPVKKRIGVEEVVVYETGVVEGFEGDFDRVLSQYLRGDADTDAGEDACGVAKGGLIWVVVFSPTGCDAMVRVLEREVQGDGGEGEGRRRVFVATIGPTTRDHLIKVCGFQPDVCAAKPSPEGVGAGIEEFMRGLESR
ncbi:uroporphyrinogen-III synthase HEM4 [Aspergillus undulatus]|uniref:uroporphyrinogen-III synthase HEM4 n=1 Tax=Aspergillus undulatus TaxID=1810928 RepID=UPI003CCD9821